ncbi:ATP-binding protein [Prevotella sp. KH2C16]|uniref:AAA family ATPase n=1 Tax=Prevotella sp. KH2C16 TaxID=1855325 RepID=UPI0008F32AE7|nr:ATP-binding protein [Prevotella sp. KH2C16]SFG62244.1 ATPase [Prevotella sp. KH2C16]
MKVPFQFGTLATKENFIDRDEDRALLKQLLTSHINVMLISPRRWGKSSLVRRSMEELMVERSDIKVCYIDAFSIGSESEFYRTFASKVIECASTKFEKWADDARKLLNGVVPQLVIKDQITNFMAFDIKFKPEERDKLSILQLPQTLAKQKGIAIIVCIDEFQQLANLPEYKDMEGKMRAVWQQQEDTTYCLYGSKRHMMMDIFNNSNNPFYRFGQVIFLDKINKENWLPFILAGFKKTNKQISEEYASQICDIVECHPWYLQQLSFFIWNKTADNVTADDFNYGVEQLLNINTPMFQADINRLTPAQIELLRAIAAGETKFSSAEVRRKYNLGNPNTLVKNKRTLQEQDIIEKTHDGGFHFVDPLFHLWMERYF